MREKKLSRVKESADELATLANPSQRLAVRGRSAREDIELEALFQEVVGKWKDIGNNSQPGKEVFELLYRRRRKYTTDDQIWRDALGQKSEVTGDKNNGVRVRQ